jgi:hypothetical protein
MLENIKGVFASINSKELPTLYFIGSKYNPLNIVVLPTLLICVSVILLIFLVEAIVIDICNSLIFMYHKGIR